jgi:hypothetical protein
MKPLDLSLARAADADLLPVESPALTLPSGRSGHDMNVGARGTQQRARHKTSLPGDREDWHFLEARYVAPEHWSKSNPARRKPADARR